MAVMTRSTQSCRISSGMSQFCRAQRTVIEGVARRGVAPQVRARALISGYCICFRSISSEEASASVMVADLSAGRAGTHENDRLGAGGGLRGRCAGTRAARAPGSLATQRLAKTLPRV